MLEVIAVTVTQDDINKPYTRTVTVITSGSGSYNLMEDTHVVKTIINSIGVDVFTVDNIPLGTHTYCVNLTTTSACDTFEVKPPLVIIDIKYITVSQDYSYKPYTRTVTVIGIGDGTYQVKEGKNIIATRNLVNGFDIFDVNNISVGTHTYCTTNSSTNACDTFVVTEQCNPIWICEQPYNGYETDGCGNRRLNNACSTSVIPICSASEINLFNKCYKRNDVYILASAIGLIMLLK